MEEQWLTSPQVKKITGQSISTIIRYGRKGYYEIRRVGKDTRPIYYNYLSIPTYLRKYPLEVLNRKKEEFNDKTNKK